MKKRAVFLDKDGTLVHYFGFDIKNLTKEQLNKDLMDEHVIEGLIHLQNKGYELFVVSNQPWVSKNIATKEEVDEIFDALVKKLAQHGIKISEYVYCPHQKSDACDCRKPSGKMLVDLANKHGLSLSDSYIIGDSDKDVMAGKNAGVKTVLVLSGETSSGNNFGADHVIKNVNGVIGLI